MFRKLRSNRDPHDTLLRELKKEFTVYFNKARVYAERITARYPMFFFGLMISLMLISVGLSFTIFRKQEPVTKAKQVPKPTLSPVSNGFDRILETGAALKETFALKKQVDSLTAKKVLNASDSATLEKDLDRLQQINNHLIK